MLCCLHMTLSQFQKAVWHWRGAGGCPSQARDYPGEVISAIKTILELGEVSGHVLGTDGTVRTDDGGFDVPERGVDPFERRASSGGRPTAGADRFMLASGIADVAETGETIADDSARRIKATQGKA